MFVFAEARPRRTGGPRPQAVPSECPFSPKSLALLNVGQMRLINAAGSHRSSTPGSRLSRTEQGLCGCRFSTRFTLLKCAAGGDGGERHAGPYEQESFMNKQKMLNGKQQ